MSSTVCYHLPIPAVIGIILGAVFFLLNVILFTFICVKWRRSVRKRRYVAPFPFCFCYHISEVLPY